MATPAWVDEVLAYWFDELGQAGWYETSEKTDATIIERFGALHENLKASTPPEAASDARTALATVIALDQFSRNMFRGTARAFETDRLALQIAAAAIDNGLDKDLNGEEVAFLYMPFMHSEQLENQDRCISLFEAIGDGNSLKHAVEHRDIVKRFGRFPHRNRAMDRDSTPEEAAFLDGHSGFGQ
jgi:uncharacterized protein (DUF924 family)